MAATRSSAGPSSTRDGPPLATYGRRNVFYLRVSPTVVLPCILYIDGRHLLWLNTHPSVFHSALAYLKTRIMAKLDREAKVIRVNTGRTTDTGAGGHWGMRGRTRHLYKEKRIWGEMSGNEKAETANQPDFNLAYFFKKQNDSHSVLIKDKELMFPKGKKPPQQPADNRSASPAEAEPAEAGGGEYVDPLSNLMNPSQPNQDDIQVKRDPDEEEQELLESLHQPIQGPQDAMDQSDDVADEKPKFKVKVRYRGFRIFGKCLILVIEPSPSARERSPDLFVSQTPQSKRQLSATPGARSVSVYPSARDSSMVDPRPQSLRQPNVDSDAGNNRDARGATVTTRRGTSSSASPAPLFFSRGDSMTPSEVGDSSEQTSASSSHDRRIRPPPTRNHQQGRATARGVPSQQPKEDNEDMETEDDFDAPFETSSEWAERMQQQSSLNNDPGPTLGDHEGVWAGESRDEYDQIMSNIGSSGYGDSADD